MKKFMKINKKLDTIFHVAIGIRPPKILKKLTDDELLDLWETIPFRNYPENLMKVDAVDYVKCLVCLKELYRRHPVSVDKWLQDVSYPLRALIEK